MKFLVTFLLMCIWPTAHRSEANAVVWGFFGHRLINRMAVFTLPSEMIGAYKFNIDFLTDHAVDPDKRRYSTPHEAVRHYIDLDRYGEYPFEKLPRKWVDVLAAYLELDAIRNNGDTIVVHHPLIDTMRTAAVSSGMKMFVARHVLPQYYEDTWSFDPDTVAAYFPAYDCSSCATIIGIDHFSQHGILPYHLYTMQRRLTDAFARKDLNAVLRISADFGHYIADAHVPLHTTSNYNGQLTGQDGIHAFWESRIPELFAEKNWDFLVGPAKYIDDPLNYYWNIVLKSHRLVKDVLNIEKQLSEEYPPDQQYCYEERMNTMVRTQCAEYAKAYEDRMQDMVETRMQDAILAVGSAWYTAWVDGGQPIFDDFMMHMNASDQAAYQDLEKAYLRGNRFGREHSE